MLTFRVISDGERDHLTCSDALQYGRLVTTLQGGAAAHDVAETLTAAVANIPVTYVDYLLAQTDTWHLDPTATPTRSPDGGDPADSAARVAWRNLPAPSRRVDLRSAVLRALDEGLRAAPGQPPRPSGLPKVAALAEALRPHPPATIRAVGAVLATAFAAYDDQWVLARAYDARWHAADQLFVANEALLGLDVGDLRTLADQPDAAVDLLFEPLCGRGLATFPELETARRTGDLSVEVNAEQLDSWRARHVVAEPQRRRWRR